MNEEEERAERELDNALKRLQSLAGPDVKPMGARVGAEQRYGAAYDRLVRLGRRRRLRRKYRRGQH
jgi:hypothetical protein